MNTTGIVMTTVLAMVHLSSSAVAQDGLALMKVEAGARPVGMAGAAVSLTADPDATFYNPAAAAWSEHIALSFGHNEYWENIRIETGYFVSNFRERLSIHGGIRYASVDNIESRLTPSAEPDALFSKYDLSWKAGVSYVLNDKVAFGLAAGWFSEKIDMYRGSAFNVDFGLLYRVAAPVNLGASVTNLGSSLSLAISGQPGTDDISLPTTYRVGGSYRYDRYLGALDMVIVDDEFHLHLGADAALHDFVSVRAGYMVGYDTKDFTAGASFSRREFTVGYAFVPYSGHLGTSHLFNLTITL